MDKELLVELNKFMGMASKATYASGGGKVEPWRKGFTELEYTDGDWYYRDSYTGFLRSWGQEVIWYKDKPVWTCLYGGGMCDDVMDSSFANETFSFLKKVLSAGDKEITFQPRGPKVFRDNEWQYFCELDGDITKYSGNEYINHNDNKVFTHDFVGGLVVGQDK